MWILTLLATASLAPCEAELERTEYRRAQKCFAKRAKSYDRAGSAESIVAHHGRARALLARGSHFRSKAALEATVERFRRATPEAKRQVRYQRAAADAAWRLLVADYADYLRITDLGDKRERAERLVRRYEAILAIGDPRTSLEVHQRLGELWFALARSAQGCERHRAIEAARRSLSRVHDDQDTTTTLGRRTSATLDQIAHTPVRCDRVRADRR